MKIKSIWVESYGSLSSLAVPAMRELSDGLNVLFGPNEAGKSQLKGFLEDTLFPKSPQRSSKDSKPLGRLIFTHQATEYLLEVSGTGSSAQRRLISGKTLLPGDISDLFPSMRIGGNDVFSSLYSFGLDELFANSINSNGVLTEHLFGAVASGKGVSINTVFDQLSDQIKKLTGKEARVRSLTKVLEEVDAANRQRLDQIAAEESFIEKYLRRAEITAEITALDSELLRKNHELRVYEEVQSLGYMYESYKSALDFLGRHPHLSTLSSNKVRSLENQFSRIRDLGTVVKEVETKIESASGQLQVLEADTGLISRQGSVRVAEKIQEDLLAIREDISKRSIALDVSKKAIERNMLKNRLHVDLDAPGDSHLKAAIETLENIKGNLDSLQRQRAEYLTSPLIDFGRNNLLDKHAKTEVSINRADELLERPPRKDRNNANAPVWATVVGILELIAIGALYKGNALVRPAEIGIEVVAGLLVVIAIYLLTNRQSSSASRDTAMEDALKDIGLSIYDARQIMAKLHQFKTEKTTIEALLKIQSESKRIEDIVTEYGITMDPCVPLDKTMEQVSGLIYTIREILDLEKTNFSVEEARNKLDSRKSELLTMLRRDFTDISIPENPSTDLLQVIVSDLADRLSSNLEIKAQGDMVQRDISAFKGEIVKLSETLESLNEEIDRQLVPLGYNHEMLDENLLELFRDYVDHDNQHAAFGRSAKSVFGDQFEEVMPYFQIGALEISELIHSLKELAQRHRDERDALLRSQAEIDAEEKRLLKINSVADIGASLESLLLEAEDISNRLRATVLARQLLKNANTRFEDLHQPELLRLSSEIFARVTQNRYISILKKEYGKGESIFARNALGQDILDSSLSRGAREQLYISIRLALVTRPASLDLPLLMDDVMVNADMDRAQGLANELSRVSRSRQILYFCAKSDAIKLFKTAGADVNLLEMDRL